ncbi:hypothetical protein [Usitatibacter palustris]|uniref:Lipoprotein n=1 Tax=Usitatibacter palustris TaxID=2732487 RepID=A0A6M4H1Y5_9PROT|nr:hypothetical protein [Usitatibacter palustris]QJR13470.1 hypothetical protein DSM104440_00254 [Usitatibacter palustris]
MTPIQHLLAAGFVLSVFATACEYRPETTVKSAATRTAVAPNPADTVMQPNNMPPPAAPQAGPESRDSAATKPLETLTKPKENTAMPEAGHGNNHSSPAFKKSSAVVPKAPKVAWI